MKLFSNKMNLFQGVFCIAILGISMALFSEINDSANKIVLAILAASALIAGTIENATGGRGLVQISESVKVPIKMVCYSFIFYIGLGMMSGQLDEFSSKIVLAIIGGCMVVKEAIVQQIEVKRSFCN